MKLKVEGVFQWAALPAWRRHNWINLSLIHCEAEWKRYAGRYFEFWFIVLGVGFWLTLYGRDIADNFDDAAPTGGDE